VSANAGVNDKFAPEILFCTFMLLASVLDAQGNHKDALAVLKSTQEMIDRREAHYLNANLQAFLCRLNLAAGINNMAGIWLEYNSESVHSHLAFYKIYQYFTTARARIANGECTIAIVLLIKLLTLSERYQRPMDIIEANILLAIAHWKRIRGVQADAFPFLKKAILLAREYKYVQIFANEGAAITNMLYKLLIMVKHDENPEPNGITVADIKKLHIAALAREHYTRSSRYDETTDSIKFTDRQKKVLSYLSIGLTQCEMAEKIGVKPSTIKSHIGLIYKKLDVSNSADALIKAREMDVF
jgi:LuxR family maltose regulon positive regulatory protein